MQVFYSFFPIFVFFVVYKFVGIYYATASAMVVCSIQLAVHYAKHKTLDKLQVITFFVIWILGSATILFHNPLFIKWKPTVVNWLFAIIFMGSKVLTHKPFIQYMLEKKITLPAAAWQRLNLSWVLFFLFVGTLNLYVAYHYSTETWVNFKLFGLLGLTLLFSIFQAIYLSTYLEKTP